jgi:hypothetical protein
VNMDDTHIHSNTQNIENNNKDVSLNQVKNIECIQKIYYKPTKIRNIKLEYLQNRRTINNNIDINYSKLKVKEMIKSAKKNKEKIVEQPRPLIDDSKSRPLIDDSQPRPLIDDSKSRPLIDDSQPRPLIDDSKSRPLIDDSQPRPLIDSKSRPLIDDSQPRPLIDSKSRPLIDDSQPRPLIDDSKPRPLIDSKSRPLTPLQPQSISKLDNILTYTSNVINDYKNTNKDIDIVLSKVRLEYENNDILKKNKKILFLNFEDDTFKAVLEVEDKYLDIIIDWYDSINLSLDIEETEYKIPEDISKNELSTILYKNIDYKYKNEYLDMYLPLMINNLLTKQKLYKFEKKIFNSLIKEDKNISENILDNLGITIPDNMIYKEDYFYNDNGKINYVKEKNNRNNNSFGRLKDIEGNFDIICYNKSSIINYDNSDTNKMYLEYNSEYNCLYNSFGDNCESIEEINKKVLNDSVQKSLIVVMFNPIYLQTIVVENPDKDTLYVIRNHNEYGFIQLFTLCINKNNTMLNTFIKKEYHQHIFNNIEELNNCLNTTSGFIDYNNLHINKNVLKINEETEVKQYITNNFNLTDNIEDKMKASELYDLILASPAINIDKDKISGFRNRLSKYLIDLGLKKKRYNDGYYYYGIVDKLKNIYSLDINSIYEKMIKEREKI